MKPVVTFVLGVVLATAIAMFVMKRDKPAEPVATAEPAAQSAPAPVPVHEAQPPSASLAEPRRGFPAARQESRPAKGVRPGAASPASSPRADISSTTTNTTTTPSTPAAPSTTSTTANTQGGPPQTTLSMPPPPDGNRPLAESKPVRVPKTVTIPAGTLLNIRVDETLSAATAQTGDSFRATLDQPVVVDGAVIAERGARVEGRVAEADRGGKVRGVSTLALELVRLNTSDGQRVRLQTDGFTKKAEKSTKKDAVKVGIGAGLGAAIGAIAGGGKGAAIGAGVGGAAGTGAVVATRGDAAEVPAETRMTFRLREPITVTEKLN